MFYALLTSFSTQAVSTASRSCYSLHTKWPMQSKSHLSPLPSRSLSIRKALRSELQGVLPQRRFWRLWFLTVRSWKTTVNKSTGDCHKHSQHPYSSEVGWWQEPCKQQAQQEVHNLGWELLNGSPLDSGYSFWFQIIHSQLACKPSESGHYQRDIIFAVPFNWWLMHTIR